MLLMSKCTYIIIADFVLNIFEEFHQIIHLNTIKAYYIIYYAHTFHLNKLRNEKLHVFLNSDISILK